MKHPFSLGQVVATPGALDLLTKHDRHAYEFLSRHNAGDWGVLDEEDARENDVALINGFRLMSAYEIGDGKRIWIITEADRSVTTILLPDEY